MIATSQFTISVINDGAPGATGPQGVSVTKVVEEYRLSNSNTELTGSGTGYTWSETKPDIPSGKYLWIRERTDLSNNTSSYGTAHCDIVISGLVQDVDRNSNAITSKVWESDITTKINEYDGSTGTAIRNRVSQTETNISGITSRVSDVESETDSLGTRMTSAESSITQNANNIALKVSQDGVISAINQSAESILISASKVDIQGAVSFSSLDSTLQGRITGVESTASTANTTANTANATANTALKGIKVYSGTCSTAAGTAAKVVSCSDTDFAMTNGVTITITFSTASTADAPKLNVNSLGAKAIYFDNAVTSSSNKFRWQAGSVITFQYNGTYWVVLNYENLEYFTSSIAAGTAAKTNASVTGTFVLCKGTTINVYFSTANTADALTLNIGATGAYAIYYKGNATGTSNKYLWDAGTTLTFTYNGSYWYVNDGGAQLVKDYAKTAVDWVGTNGTTVITAADIMKTWTDDATLATTTIDGGYIKTHTIESTHLATNAIMSQNYSRTDTSSPYSSGGTFLDLTNGNIYTPNLGIDNVGGTAYLNGTIYASAGQIGNPGDAYWSIGTVYDSTWGDYAGLIANGNALIQSGKLTLSSDRLNSQNAGNYIQSGGYWYDFGLQVPDFTAGTNSHDQNFLYVRRINHQPTDSTLDTDWSYLFRVDKAGNIYWNGHDISDGTFLPLSGGTVTGATTFSNNLTVSGAFTASGNITTNLMIQTNLASTSAAQLTGNANATVTHGVTGTLGVGNGGTGQTTAQNAANAFITALPNWTATPTDDTYFIRRDTAGSATYGQVKFSTLWTYINNKISSIYDITNTYRRLDDDQFDTIDATDIEAGNLIVTGAGRFTNGLYGNLIGNADTATTATTANKVANSLQILFNSGSTEGTNKFTFDGSSPKNVNITKSSIGLGSVENTALSTWAGSSNLTTTKVGTLAAAATKGVDTSISAGSTSTNLPTSKAVATFVEGKGYVTSSGVTSITLKAGTGIFLDTDNTAITSTGSRTISLANTYGDTINPYGNKTANYVLAGPSSGSAATPSFRALVAADIPSITKSKISDFPTTWALSNVTGADDLKAIEALTGTSGILKKTAANSWSLTTVISGLSINNDVITVTKSDGTTQDLTVNVTGQIVSGATILTNSSGQAISLGSASAPVYFSNGVPAQANTIPTVTLNGTATTSASFYAPTGAGTSGQILKSNGSGAPTWVNQNTLQVERATKDGDGNTISSTYLKLSGGTLTNPNNIFYNAPQGSVIPVSTISVLQSPIPKYLWHDLWAFCKATTPKYYTTLDGTTWTEGTLEKRFFAHLESWGYAEIIKSNGIIGSRWEWDGGGFAYCSGSWLVIGVTYASPIAKFDVLLEESADTGESGTWTTLCSSVGVSVNQQPVWIKTNGPSKNNIRLTITRNSESGTTTTLPIVSLRWLSYRWGNQGKGQEYEYPYTWDGDGNMTLKGDFTGTINTSNNTWNNIGDDIQIGDINKGGHLGIQGKNANTGIFFTTYGQTTKTVGGAITWDGSKFIITGTIDTSISGNAATATSATKATQDSDGNAINTTYLKRSGGTMTGQLKTNGVDIVLGATGTGNSPNDSGDLVWQYGNGTEKMRLYSSDTYTEKHGIAFRQYDENQNQLYNGKIPLADGTDASGTWGISITGSAGSATKATQDSDGNTINTTYAKLSGATFTGAIKANAGVYVNATSGGDTGGIGLYGLSDVTSYGIAMRTTGNSSGSGKHGFVQGGWAIYNYMNCVTNEIETRGWIYQRHGGGNVASISTAGHAVFNGSVTVGGNTTNTSGMRMEYDATLQCTNFVFN